MNDVLTVLAALRWVLAGIGLICCLSGLAVLALVYRDQIDTRYAAEDALTFGSTLYPLPAPDAPDDAFDDWSRQVVGLRRVPFRESETFARIAAVIAHNEAARTDWDNWPEHFGGGAA